MANRPPVTVTDSANFRELLRFLCPQSDSN
jgi:hypothetical protein